MNLIKLSFFSLQIRKRRWGMRVIYWFDDEKITWHAIVASASNLNIKCGIGSNFLKTHFFYFYNCWQYKHPNSKRAESKKSIVCLNDGPGYCINKAQKVNGIVKVTPNLLVIRGRVGNRRNVRLWPPRNKALHEKTWQHTQVTQI